MTRRIVVGVLVLGLAACGPDEEVTVPSGADAGTRADAGPGCSAPCGDDCCEANEICEEGQCKCQPACDGRACGPDGCGSVCGYCELGFSCDEAAGQCVCVPESDEALCARKNRCGVVHEVDDCGAPRPAIDCGGCSGNQICDEETKTCEPCTTEPAEAFCANPGVERECGWATGIDRCGDEVTIDCGECADPLLCDPENGRCVTCLPETEEQWCKKNGRDCGPIEAYDGCGNLRTFHCGTCADPEVCGPSFICAEPGKPANDDCARPEVLLFDAAGKAEVQGDLAIARNDTSGSCDADFPGRDLVYSFTIPEGHTEHVRIQVQPGSDLAPSLFLRTTCEAPGSEAACARARAGETAWLDSRRLPAGTWYLWVDGSSTTGFAPFTLTVERAAPGEPPIHDTCPGAEALTLDPQTGRTTVAGTTAEAIDDFAVGCASAGGMPHSGPDLLYVFELATPSAVTARLAADPTFPGYQPAVHIRSDCEGGGSSSQELACGEASWGVAVAAAASLPAGTYYVVVDGLGNTGGAFTLDLTASEPMTNDECASALELVFHSDKVLVRGDTSAASNSGSSKSCLGIGKDVVYWFKLDAPRTADLVLTASHPWDSVLHLRTACSDANKEVICRSASGANAITVPLAAGTYYAWVDGNTQGEGPFTLEVTLSDPPDPPENDGCQNPEPIPVDAVTGLGSAVGDTTFARDDAQGSCRADSGNDLVYWFELTLEKNVEISVRPAAGSMFQPLLFLRASCGDPEPETACIQATGANAPAKLDLKRLQPGKHYLWVDTRTATSQGRFTVDLKVTEPPPRPEHDSCAGAQLLVLDPGTGAVSTQGSTADATNDYAGTCGAAPATPHTGPDVVYRFSLSEPAGVVARVTPGAATPLSKPVVYIRTRCESAGAEDEAACANSEGASATALARLLPANETFFVIVDGGSASAGSFELELRRIAPIAHDTCSHPKQLALDAAGHAVETGETTWAVNDSAGACGGSGSPDLVYQLDIDGEKNVTITLAPNSFEYVPVLHVREADCEGPQMPGACDSTGMDGSRPVSLRLKKLPKGTYYIWVDGTSSRGPFTLTVDAVDPPPPPQNDTCEKAQALVFDPDGKMSISSTTENAVDDYTGNCSFMAGGDLVFSFHLDRPSGLTVTVARESGVTYWPAVYIRTDCTGPGFEDEAVCKTHSNGVASLVTSLPAGDYYLFVDGTLATSGPFTMEVSTGPEVPGDNCTLAHELRISEEGPVQVEGDTTAASNAAGGSCSGSSANDLVYRFVTVGEKDLTVLVTPKTGSTLRPAVYLRSDCALKTTEPTPDACAYASTEATPVTLRVPRLPEGKWFLWVDGASSTKGAFDLQVSALAPPRPPDNDVCAGAEPLVTTGGSAYVSTASTTLATDTTRGTCANGTGPDLVYSFATETSQKLTASVARAGTSGTFAPMIYLRSACDRPEPGMEIACARQHNGSATLVVSSLPKGTYYLWVDGVDRSSGDFSLNVTLGEVGSGPANDSCASAQVLAFTGNQATAHGTTVGGNDDAQGSCGATNAGMGPDAVFAFEIDSPQKVTVTVEPMAGYAPAVYLRRECSSFAQSNERLCTSTMSSGATITASAGELAKGTWYVWVDSGANSTSSNAGTFDLTIQLGPAAPGPVNDTCSGAIEITAGAPVSGDSTGASMDLGDGPLSPVCASMSTRIPLGPDLVYRYVPTSSGTFTVTLSPAPSFDALVWVSEGVCEAQGAHCVALADRVNAGNTETVAVKGVAGTTYYIFVDSRFTASNDRHGSFNLTVK